jgi:hypothetical protein
MSDITKLWHYQRPDLAQSLARELAARERLAMFGPRQTGKTTLLREEVIPVLRDMGLLPIYIECWADRADPMAAINHALTKALETLELAPGRPARRLARTPVRKLGAFGASLELGELPARRLPDSPTLRFDALLTQLLEATDKDLVLIFDEFQAIAEAQGSDDISAGLRAALTQADKRVGAVFSGSSQHLLLGMFTASKAPLYNFANARSYPLLREDFVGHVAARFREATQRDLNQALALNLLERLGHQPAPFLQVIGNAMSAPGLSLDEALRVMLSPGVESVWTVAWRGLKPLHRATLRLVAQAEAPTSARSLALIAGQVGKAAVPASSVDRALKSMLAQGLLEKQSRYEVADPVMLTWLRANADLPIRE